MDKKGIQWYLAYLPQIIIGAIILAIIFLVIFPKLLNMAASGGTEEAARNNFDVLTDTIEDMLEREESFTREEILYSIPIDYALVGFDKERTRIPLVSKGGDEGYVYKPDKCLDQACLCIYEGKPSDNPEDKDENVQTCELFENDVRFLGRIEPQIGLFPRGDDRNLQLADEDEHNYEYLYLYFENKGVGSEAYGKYYLAKIEKDEAIYVLITPLEDEFERHYQLFLTCPTNSDDLCKNQPHDSLVFDEDEETYYRCSYDSTLRFRCLQQKVEECSLNVEADKPCVCGETLMETGDVCSDGESYDLNCDNIERCEDYCEDPGMCYGDELNICEADPCRPEEGRCELRTQQGRSSARSICT